MSIDTPIPATKLPAAEVGALHLLDASTFWAATGSVRRVLSTKHARLGIFGWRHTLLAPGARGTGQVDCGGLALPGLGGDRLVLDRQHTERLIERAAPDLIEAADPYLLAWASLGAAERLQVPTVAFCHHHLPAQAARRFGGRHGLATRRGRWAAARARDYLVDLYHRFDLVMAPSAALAQQLRLWGVPQVVQQPLGVDCRVFQPAARDAVWRYAWCERRGIDATTKLLVYSGRFAPEKNLQLLADAVRLLGPGHLLLAVGNGPAPPRGPGVHVLPPLADAADMARLVASCDAYLHAGDQETFGLGVLEAMACGTPVVAADLGALSELVRDAGMLVAQQHPQEWAEAIEASLGGGGARWVGTALTRAREHDWPWILAQLSQRYTALVYRHARQHVPVVEAARVPRLVDGV